MADPAAFATQWGSYAATAAAQTGVPAEAILAQWADETGFGTSSAFVSGHNFAGVSPGGSVASYPSYTSGLAAYIQTLNSPLYNGARVADPAAAAVALGQSPWAASHYSAGGGGPGSDLLNIMAKLPGVQQLASIFGTPIPGTGNSGPNIGPNIPGDIASTIIGALRKPLIEAVAIFAALGLVALGVWKAVSTSETFGPAAQDAKKVAEKGAEVAAA